MKFGFCLLPLGFQNCLGDFLMKCLMYFFKSYSVRALQIWSRKNCYYIDLYVDWFSGSSQISLMVPRLNCTFVLAWLSESVLFLHLVLNLYHLRTIHRCLGPCLVLVILKEGRKYDSHDRESKEFLKCQNIQQVKLPKSNWLCFPLVKTA